MVEADFEKPHVALVTSPGMGHIIPLFELARRLVTQHNFQVSFLVITTTATSSSAQHRHLSTDPVDGLRVIDLPPADVSHIVTDDMPPLARISHIVDESIRTSLRTVLVGMNRPKAVIMDIFCTRAIDVCESLEIPVYWFVTTSAEATAFVLYLPKLDQETVGEFADLIEPVQVPGCRPVRGGDVIDTVQNRKTDEYRWLLLHAVWFPKVAGILVNTWEDLEPVSIRAIKENQYFRDISTPPLYPIGPIIRQDEPVTNLNIEILNFLDKQPVDSVLYIALGSGGTLSTQQLTELALGLELSQQRFILVTRKPHDEGILNMGDDKDDPVAYLPKGFIERVDGVGLVLPEWAPQLAVLHHESTGGFLSHCGWNSTLESISCGVPMIAWPMFAEQRMNAVLMTEEVGVAMWPKGWKEGKGVVGRDEMAREVKELMEGIQGKGLRKRAKELQDHANKALGFNGTSSRALSCVAEIWKSEHASTIVLS